MAASDTREQVRLTPRGAATRSRIIEAAAQLIFERGAIGTSLADVRAAAGVSGSQMTHYFADKDALIRAVLAWRADSVIDYTKITGQGSLDSFGAIQTWADAYIERADACRGGCAYGSLAAEVMKIDPESRDVIADGFQRWEDLFLEGLTRMQQRGELREDADPQALTFALMAAFQGGMLLGDASDSVAPLQSALTGAIAYVRSFAA